MNKNIDRSSTAFIAEDVVLKNKHGRPLVATPSLIPTTVVYCSTCWSYQKNGYNGRVITYTRNLDNPDLCYVSTIRCILSSAQLLIIKSGSHIAVAVLWKKRKLPSFLTRMLVTIHSHAASKIVHGIKFKTN